MVRLQRIWLNVDDNYKIRLFFRPRVSIHVDKYIWNLIEKNIVEPRKIMQSSRYDYQLVIAFDRFDTERQRYFPLSPYNGELKDTVTTSSQSYHRYFREDFIGGEQRTTWFSPQKFWTNSGTKTSHVGIVAANVDENIAPNEYASLLFDGFAATLLFNFKKLKLYEFEHLKEQIDWDVVNSFPFPAAFEQQQYLCDENIIQVTSLDGGTKTILVGPYRVRELYKEHFRDLGK